MAKVFDRALKVTGENVKVGATNVTVLEYDVDNNVRRCSGTSVPTGAGYAKGCIFIKTDAANSSKALYENKGTTSSASFDIIGDVATADITDGAVTLAKLATGVTPSHVVKYAGTITWSGSGTSKAATVTGVTSTDIVVASIKTAPSQAAYIVSVAPTTDTITVVLSAANTSNDAVIAYQVLRAAS